MAFYHDYGYVDGYDTPQPIGSQISIPFNLIENQIGKVEGLINTVLFTKPNTSEWFRNFVHFQDLLGGLVYGDILSSIESNSEYVEPKKKLLLDFDTISSEIYNARISKFSTEEFDEVLKPLLNEYHLSQEINGEIVHHLRDRKSVSNSFGTVFFHRLEKPEWFIDEQTFNDLIKDIQSSLNFITNLVYVLQTTTFDTIKNLDEQEKAKFTLFLVPYQEAIQNGHDFGYKGSVL